MLGATAEYDLEGSAPVGAEDQVHGVQGFSLVFLTHHQAGA
jgi:hypothetical protein